MNSATVVTGTDGFTCMIWGTRTMLATGAVITDEVVVEFFKQRRVDRGGGPDYGRTRTCRWLRAPRTLRPILVRSAWARTTTGAQPM
jgi:hypothetical protein